MERTEILQHIEDSAKQRVQFLLERERAVNVNEEELRAKFAALNIAEFRISQDPMTEEIVIVLTRGKMMSSKRNTLAGVLEEMAIALPAKSEQKEEG